MLVARKYDAKTDTGMLIQTEVPGRVSVYVKGPNSASSFDIDEDFFAEVVGEYLAKRKKNRTVEESTGIRKTRTAEPRVDDL